MFNLFKMKKGPMTIEAQIRVGDEVLKTIYLGEKKNLKPYTQAEIDYVNSLGKQVGVPYKNALMIENIRKNHQEQLDLNRKLLQSEKETALAKEREKNIRELSYFITHEFKNALLTIQENIQKLAKDSQQPELVEDVQKKCQELYSFSKNYLTEEWRKIHEK